MASLYHGRPVWLRQDRGTRQQRHRALASRREVDVAVIGAGLTGSLVAVLFAEAGVHVGLIDAALVGQGSTAASTALLLQEPDLGLGGLTERYGPSNARRIWQLSRQAARGLVQTIRRLRIDCELRELDSVYYTIRSETVRALHSECQRRVKAGFPAKWLTPGALRRLTALPGRGAILTHGNAQFDPYKACLGLIDVASDLGVEIFERSEVRRIDQLRHGVRVVTAGGSLLASQVVVATGYATPVFQPLVGRFRMSHTYVLPTSPLDHRQRDEIGLGDVMLWDTERPYHYARWTPDQRLLIGGADRPFVSTRRRHAAFKAGTRDLRQYFERLLPALADVPFESAWDGLFANTPDSLPYIGRHRRYPRHLFALGYGGNGMTFGFMAARMLLEMWQRRPSADHALFTFTRK